MSRPDLPSTRLTLIGAVRQGLRWEEFVALYGQLILTWGCRDFGLQACDAENLCQEVLLKVWKGIKDYDAQRGRFRNWLYVCTRNAILNLKRKGRGERVGRDELQMLEDRPGASFEESSSLARAADLDLALASLDAEGFALEHLQAAVVQVRARVQPATWKAFLLFEFFELSAKEIGPRLNLTPAAVNQAVFRVRHLLQQALAAGQGAQGKPFRESHR